ncbi:hypothetical protein D3C72_783510 [compost metagenome]
MTVREPPMGPSESGGADFKNLPRTQPITLRAAPRRPSREGCATLGAVSTAPPRTKSGTAAGATVWGAIAGAAVREGKAVVPYGARVP